MSDKSLVKIKEALLKNKKVLLLVIIGFLGIGLIVLSEFETEKKDTDDNSVCVSEQDYEKTLEKRLEEIISQIDGAGRTIVMVKLYSTEKSEYLKNTQSDFSSDGNEKSEEEYIVVRNGNSEQGVVVKKEYPAVQGVAVVCEGGNIGSVKNDITNAVSSLTGISKNNIAVLKMKYTEEQK
ncbi:MAG: hypothetical protein E7514_04735 [Ruminococcaceae bacterium]|nr:hypothetical protein [Oscillospiraceae bacterium]